MIKISSRKKYLKWTLYLILISIVGLNVIACFHAYKFTHFVDSNEDKTKKELTSAEKLKVLLFGVNNPRPKNKKHPKRDYSTFYVKSNVRIECWKINVFNSKGTIILFHGYGGEKSSLLDKSEIFNKLGFNTVLVDFSGSGGSEGNRTTIGYLESTQVLDVFNKLKSEGIDDVFLFGTSMGAVAIMKAIADNKISPNGLILECPFGTMHETVKARFKIMRVPEFPMADLLMFWGGIQNGFWAYDHNPKEYAKQIEIPVLLMTGGADKKVSLNEINQIFKNLKGKKELKIYENAGHENYLLKYKKEWSGDVYSFLQTKKATTNNMYK